MIGGVNLIPIQRQQLKAKHRRLRRWIMNALYYCSLLAFAFSACYFKFAYPVHPLDAEITSVESNAANIDRSLASTRAQLAELNQRLDSARAATNHPDWSILLALVSNTLSDDIVLSSCSINRGVAPDQSSLAAVQKASLPAPSGGSPAKVPAPATNGQTWIFSINGLGRSPSAVSQFVLRLESSELFDNVQLNKTTREPFHNAEATSFHIDCTLAAKGRASR